MMHRYRTHTCGVLNKENCNTQARLSGWVHRKRDHGNLIFLDLRDHFGMMQCVIDVDSPIFGVAETLRPEDVVTMTGQVVERTVETVNTKMATGEVELQVDALEILSRALQPLPLQVNSDMEFPEDTRLKYRFLDLRREKLHQNIVLRSRIIASLRMRMQAQGFLEYQTPILTASSPEGARDFLVPSRLHPGKFYALPQAPQQFKQLLMVYGFDRYFQIAPCFRDEDARADRSPGEFYQLDLEMSFVTQEDVFAAIEPVLAGVFEEFAQGKAVTQTSFPRIAYQDALLHYGTDKPDLRNPLCIRDVTDIFLGSTFTAFVQALEQGAVVRAIVVPDAAKQSRSFFDKLNDWAKGLGMPGLGYLTMTAEGAKGPIAKFLNTEQTSAFNLEKNSVIFFVCDQPALAAKRAGLLRTHLGEQFQLIDSKAFRFCWFVDFPMYERDEKTGAIVFSHNPFSMPQGGLEALMTQDPLTINAYQYDIVCNGVELCSGAIRNHLPDVMYKAFEIAGYGAEVVEARFGGMLNAFKYGAPPHGGCAPGIDRMVMLLADEPNLREIIAFPMTQNAEDLLMGAPAAVTDMQLKELKIKSV